MSSKTRTSLLSLTIVAVLLFSAIGPTIVYADDGTTSDTTTAETSVSGDGSSECSSAEGATDTSDGECTSDEEVTDTGAEGTASESDSLEEVADAIVSADDSSQCSSDEDATDTSSSEDTSSECTSDEESTNAGGGEGDSSESDPIVVTTDTSDSGDEAGLSDAVANAEVTDASEGESSSEEVAATTAEPVVEETAPTEESSLLSGVPENTTVTVINTDGEPEPLATQEAAEAIASTTDPIWCPVVNGTPTPPGGAGCTQSFSSFDALLTFLSGNPTYQGTGIIYVEQGAYIGGETSIDFSSYNLSNISSSDLTVQGGWNTTTNTVDPASTSTFTIPILIGTSLNPWGGSLTINNIVMNNVTDTGLILYSQNNVNLSNVQVINSTNGGGAELHAGGNVTINNSKFLRNNTTGALIRAGGSVAIANSEFSNPSNAHRQLTGLDVVSSGSVSLFNVLANENRKAGATINAGGRVTIGSSVFSSNMSLNSSTFYGYGLQVVTPDAIDLANVTANNNFLWGADLDAGGDVAIVDSTFNGNSTSSNIFIDDTGLLITSGGNVALNNVQANDNRLIGSVIDAVGTVSVNNSSFSNNRGVTTVGGVTTLHGLGLEVVSDSSVFLNGVTASGNTLFGAHLEAGGEVAVNNSTFSNNSTGSATDLSGRGLEVISAGNASIANTVLDSNQTFGAAIQAGGQAFLDLLTATNNSTDGVQASAVCTHLNGGTYSGNGQYGLNLTNSPLDLVSSPTFANNGAGDIFPASPTTCAPLVMVSPTNIGSSGQSGLSSSNAGGALVSYSTVSRVGVAATSLPGLTLNGLMYGITKEAISGGRVTSIFVGNYIYVYTVYDSLAEPILDNLQIIAVSPAPAATGVAMVGP